MKECRDNIKREYRDLGISVWPRGSQEKTAVDYLR